MEQIKKGDIVRLKSGSPKMTVTATEEKLVYCSFYDKKEGKMENITKPYEALKKVFCLFHK